MDRNTPDPETPWDVVIVGAGPAGAAAALAALQTRPDASVLLLDAAEFPRDKVCGDGVARFGEQQRGGPDGGPDAQPQLVVDGGPAEGAPGWLGRALDCAQGRGPDAVHIGNQSVPRALVGRRSVTTSFADASDLTLALPIGLPGVKKAGPVTPEADDLTGGRLGKQFDRHLTCSPTGSDGCPAFASVGPCT
jgi:hypothetical protein